MQNYIKSLVLLILQLLVTLAGGLEVGFEPDLVLDDLLEFEVVLDTGVGGPYVEHLSHPCLASHLEVIPRLEGVVLVTHDTGGDRDMVPE